MVLSKSSPFMDIRKSKILLNAFTESLEQARFYGKIF